MASLTVYYFHISIQAQVKFISHHEKQDEHNVPVL